VTQDVVKDHTGAGPAKCVSSSLADELTSVCACSSQLLLSLTIAMSRWCLETRQP
jgi:hypothetical protein